MKNSVLVTGGAGYIGSHVVKQLGEAGHDVVVLDDLSKGNRDAVLYGELVVGNTGDLPLVSRLLDEHQVNAVMHFAAHTVVPESIADPLKYYANNTCNSRNLIQCCQRAGTPHFIFSSTAAVYGMPAEGNATEETPAAPINPYGMSKLMTERMLEDLYAAGGPSYAILRYFNVAGCDPTGRIGQSTPNATLLTKVACEAAVGLRDNIHVFGTDYPTPDGTGVRDYIHVEDLADAHLKALHYLSAGGESVTLNCGYGRGYSVKQVIDAVERLSGVDLHVIESDRRAGDPSTLIAVAERIRTVLDWQPRYDDLDVIVKTALDWERKVAGRV